MAARVGLLQSLCSRPAAYRTPLQSVRTLSRSTAVAVARPAPSRASRPSSLFYAVGLTLGLTSLTWPQATQCAASSPLSSSTPGRIPASPSNSAEPPQSVLDVYQLGFGAACGICAGVFVKKGLRAIAFLLGGAFVLLQSYITVDWKRLSSRYDTAFGTKTGSGDIKAPTVGGFFNGIVDFLSANFQQRATFVAGFVLGVRLG